MRLRVKCYPSRPRTPQARASAAEQAAAELAVTNSLQAATIKDLETKVGTGCFGKGQRGGSCVASAAHLGGAGLVHAPAHMPPHIHSHTPIPACVPQVSHQAAELAGAAAEVAGLRELVARQEALLSDKTKRLQMQQEVGARWLWPVAGPLGLETRVGWK